MKVAEILDRITDAQRLAGLVQDKLRAPNAEIRGPMYEEYILLEKADAEDILQLITKYLECLEDKEVK